MIFTCAGAAHVGQVANRTGVQLRQEKVGALFCVVAVAAEIPDKLDRTRNAARRVIIDGCDDHCCRKVMEKAGLSVEVDVLVTDLDIEKQPAEPSLINDTKKVVEHVKAQLSDATG